MVYTRICVSADGGQVHLRAVDEAFGADIHYSMLIKLYGEPSSSLKAAHRYSSSECVGTRKNRITGNPDPKHVSTCYETRLWSMEDVVRLIEQGEDLKVGRANGRLGKIKWTRRSR